YYNMTDQGLRNLFTGHLDVEKVEVYGSGLPIFALAWILKSWSEGLDGRAREGFLKMRVPGEGQMRPTFSRGFEAEVAQRLARIAFGWPLPRREDRTVVEVSEQCVRIVVQASERLARRQLVLEPFDRLGGVDTA